MIDAKIGMVLERATIELVLCFETSRHLENRFEKAGLCESDRDTLLLGSPKKNRFLKDNVISREVVCTQQPKRNEELGFWKILLSCLD